ncbi:flavin reductase [Kibdelosporangium aridum]|uniref:Flavin reductase n=1 Tax=Kibdelosporangium aridum TaxID=2030 RepID=A0A428Z0H9_KIBAR|nr:flavin reductase family protein [Kibdelosporangium aridum]RSM77787.1 flavin reductase [Kibdelosporangium aridum]
MTVDTMALRSCLGLFATGVTVVTTDSADGVHGVTVNAFSSVSLDPSLVMVSLDRRSKACDYLGSSPFCVNILAASQHDVALHFAGRRGTVPADIRWADDDGTPRLLGCLATISCTPWASYDGGDHVLHLGEVQHVELGEGDPLVFHRKEFHQLGRPAPTGWQPGTRGAWRWAEILRKGRKP